MSDKIKEKRQRKITFGIFLICISLVACYILFRKVLSETDDKLKIIWSTSFLTAFTLLIFGISWIMLSVYDPNPNNVTLKTFFDFSLIFYENILVGLSKGLIFGFIDNFGMYLGLDSLESLLKDSMPNPMVRAGIGNLYSSIFGSIMGASLSKGIKKSTGIIDTPWWSDTIGILIGSILGIYIPSLVMPRQSAAV
jgi:hypothetical protein